MGKLTKFKLAGVLAAMMALAVVVSACGPSSAAKKTYTIALVPGITTDPFYITMHAGAAAEAKKLGVKLIWEGGTSFSPESQIPVVESLLAKHPSALLIAPTDVKALIGPIKQFVAAHIPVITVDTTIADTSILVSRITSDNYQGGEAAADTCAKLAHDTGSVAVINVEPGITTTDARQAGFLHEMKTKYPQMPVVATEYDQDSETIAETETEDVILAHPHLKCVFGTNLYSAEGAGEAVVHEGKKGQIFVAGYDAEPAEVQLLKQGVINILVVQNPAEEGKLGVEYAYDYLTGHKNLIKKFVQLPNIIATTQNASNPNIAKYFYLSSYPGS
jgi:ribose transport system substrate-binding protein